MIIAQANTRKTIGAPDKLFGVSNKAKARIKEIGKENVINSTIGVLLNDEGELVVLESVMDCIRALSPEDYAAYAPITGIPEYLEGVKKAIFLDDIPEGAFIESCYTPGGTGALRNAVSAYTKPGDAVLTSDWHWNPYNIIAQELGREIKTYTLFDEDLNFNAASFEEKFDEVIANQEQIVCIINTPAHNPTGYTFTDSDWDKVIEKAKSVKDKNVIIVVDIAYLDFAGDAKEYRAFIKKLTGLPANILPLFTFSGSKGFTMYGMRCGALTCMAPTAEIAKEFKDVMSVECRASWSNGNRAAMTVLAGILADDELHTKVVKERDYYMDILKRRGQIFMEESEKVGLKPCPYDSGFFISIPCDNPDGVSEILQKQDVFLVAMGKGLRVSVASNTEEECRKMPAIIKAAFDEYYNK